MLSGELHKESFCTEGQGPAQWPGQTPNWPKVPPGRAGHIRARSGPNLPDFVFKLVQFVIDEEILHQQLLVVKLVQFKVE